MIIMNETDTETAYSKADVGDVVAIIDSGCRGFITGIIVREGFFLEYEVSYYIGDSYRRDVFSGFQLSF